MASNGTPLIYFVCTKKKTMRHIFKISSFVTEERPYSQSYRFGRTTEKKKKDFLQGQASSDL